MCSLSFCLFMGTKMIILFYLHKKNIIFFDCLLQNQIISFFNGSNIITKFTFQLSPKFFNSFLQGYTTFRYFLCLRIRKLHHPFMFFQFSYNFSSGWWTVIYVGYYWYDFYVFFLKTYTLLFNEITIPGEILFMNKLRLKLNLEIQPDLFFIA